MENQICHAVGSFLLSSIVTSQSVSRLRRVGARQRPRILDRRQSLMLLFLFFRWRKFDKLWVEIITTRKLEPQTPVHQLPLTDTSNTYQKNKFTSTPKTTNTSISTPHHHTTQPTIQHSSKNQTYHAPTTHTHIHVTHELHAPQTTRTTQTHTETHVAGIAHSPRFFLKHIENIYFKEISTLHEKRLRGSSHQPVSIRAAWSCRRQRWGTNKERMAASSVTLTPNTFMRNHEVKYQKFGKTMARHAVDDGHNSDKVRFSVSELLVNLVGHFTTEQIDNVTPTS